MIAGAIIASIDEATDAAQLGADKKEESEDADFSEEAAYMNGMCFGLEHHKSSESTEQESTR